MVIFPFLFVIIWSERVFFSLLDVFIVCFFPFTRYVCLLSFAVSYHTFIHCDCCNVTFNDKRALQKTLTLTLSVFSSICVSLYSSMCIFCLSFFLVGFFFAFHLSFSFTFCLSHISCSFYLSHFMQETAIIRFFLNSFTFSLRFVSILRWSFPKKLWHLNQ